MAFKKHRVAGLVLALCIVLATSRASAQDCCTDHLACQDGVWCTGIEYCNCYGGCVSGIPPGCHDGDPFTTDKCVNDVIDTPGMGYGTGHCEHLNTCIDCTTDGDCADGDTCTTDTCVSGACVNAEIPGCCLTDEDCEDDEVCTDDACVAGVCSNTPVTNCCHLDSECDDLDPCTDDACTLNRCENVSRRSRCGLTS